MLPCLPLAVLALQGGKPAAPAPLDRTCIKAPSQAYDSRWKWLDLPIKAVCLSDSDGGREVKITSEQIKRGLVFANAAYARARVRFVFDPAKDMLHVKSTLLNRIEASDVAGNDCAQAIAAKFPGYVTLFFRWGAGTGPTGGCYSGFGGKTVMMCFYWDSPPPVPQNVWLIGHEVGHYLGLDHTFGPSFGTIKEAEKYFKEHKDDPACFDGDGLDDTPPEPCIGELAEKTDVRTATLDGKRLTLDRENVMNYTGSLFKTMSRAQALRVRWSVENKVLRWGSSLPSNSPSAAAWKLKDLKLIEKDGAEPFTTLDPYENGIMRGDGRVTSHAKVGSHVEYETEAVAGGRYKAVLYGFSSTDLGVVKILVDGRPIGKPIDFWTPVDYIPTGAIELGTLDLKAGAHRLRIDVVGKNRESSAAHWSIEALDLLPEAPQK